LSFQLRCDKSGGMKRAALVSVLTALLAFAGCSGGGGGSTAPAGAVWPKFRHDVNNSGAGGGAVAGTPTPHVFWTAEVNAAPTPTPGAPGAGAAQALDNAIISSPAIGIDGTIYVGSQSGTLAAINANGTIRWRVDSCECPGPAGRPTPVPHLGAFTSSPAVFTVSGKANIMIGSAATASGQGRVYVFQDDGIHATCAACSLEPLTTEFCSNPASCSVRTSFISSPSFQTSSFSGNISGILIGAQIDVEDGAANMSLGALYAFNNDGSVNWRFPRSGAVHIGPITSSPAFGSGGTLYFTAADTVADVTAGQDHLYALNNDGTLRWSFGVGRVTDPSAPFSASPLVDSQIFVATADGRILSVEPGGGGSRWTADPGVGGFVASLAAGNPAATATPTPTPANAPTSSPLLRITPTPTATPPTGRLFGVTKDGVLVAVDAATGALKTFLDTPLPVAPPVISSPALSSDSYLVFGDGSGALHVINSLTGLEAPGFPLALTQAAIRSSPTITDTGTIYVGADDGVLYAVETQ
jgi:outer membrane protein assembly factor BamB